ncbi:MAG TPA: adenosylcobinamide-GDP ribazoletransferase [Methylococcaceae bacterium]|nr:adenosylcobinamide-GDP ribazoletransferase [Methylococcaceae bacterium]HIA45889.1 adenosylcobinamide-GDP ribazoletransferase [Methylococcaceae bacterium]HIO37671.1 adenosylcobinamide-GDP ribazoletransferase [Rhodospirillales bacterium]
MSLPLPFLIALQFLTIYPIRLKEHPSKEMTGRSLLYYPVVGLFLGALFVIIAWLFTQSPPSIIAALVLALWILLTGALHLDGLADSADALIGGFGNRERTLEIMKDPYCGPAAVVSLVLILLIKFTALEQLINTENWLVLALTPVLGRTILIILLQSTPYARPAGLGSALAKYSPRQECLIIIILTFASMLLLLGVTVFWIIIPVAAIFMILRTLMLSRIGGTTGDTAGAVVEITETIMLVTTALL